MEKEEQAVRLKSPNISYTKLSRLPKLTIQKKAAAPGRAKEVNNLAQAPIQSGPEGNAKLIQGNYFNSK